MPRSPWSVGRRAPRSVRVLATAAALIAAAVAAAVVAAVVTWPAPAVATSLTSESVAPPAGRATSPARIIIDTDLSLWWDDATAVGMANVLQQRGVVRIVAIMSDIRNPVAVAAIDAIDTAYGHPHIPLGAVAHSSANTAPHGYSDVVARDLPHAIRSSAQVPQAVSVFRRTLASQPNHSVTIVAIGGDTNLAALLRSKPDQNSVLGGRALIARKVMRLVIEDGLFPNGAPPLTNEHLDPAATREIVSGTDWPTPIDWVDGYAGIETRVGGALCTTVPPNNPMRIVYEAEFGCAPPGDGDWDGPTLLYAVMGADGMFSELGQGGAAYINAAGGLSWRTDPHRPHDHYIHVSDQGALNARIDSLLAAR
jgi:hypothetical protein